MAGWTLTIDLPAGASASASCSGSRRLCATRGGRHYLAKDSHTTPESIRRGYPRLAEWQEARHKADPEDCDQRHRQRLELIG